MENLSDILMCPIHLEQFQLKTHEPYTLICGHTLCMEFIIPLYKKNEVKCP